MTEIVVTIDKEAVVRRLLAIAEAAEDLARTPDSSEWSGADRAQLLGIAVDAYRLVLSQTEAREP